jgi:hypothetical protein
MRNGTDWLSYNIHDVVKIRTNISGFDFPNYFRVPSVEPNLEIEMVDHVERPRMDEVKRMLGYGSYWMGDGRLVHETDVPFLYLLGSNVRWRSLVTGLTEEKTKIVTAVPGFRLRPVRAKVTQLLSRMSQLLITMKLLEKGLAPCYSTTASMGDNAFLLFGYSWTGKSTLLSSLLDLGFEYLSDDFTIVDEARNAYAYPDWHSPRKARIEFPAFKYLRGRTPDWRKARDQMHNVRDRAKVHSLVLLERGEEACERLDKSEALRRVMLINLQAFSRLWNSPMSEMISFYSYLYPELRLGRLVDRYKSVMAALVRNADCYLVRSKSPQFEGARRLITRMSRGG